MNIFRQNAFIQKQGLKSNSSDTQPQFPTVPSCSTHNTEKSKDDLYLLAMFSSYIDNNPDLRSEITLEMREKVLISPFYLIFFTDTKSKINSEFDSAWCCCRYKYK